MTDKAELERTLGDAQDRIAKLETAIRHLRDVPLGNRRWTCNMEAFYAVIGMLENNGPRKPALVHAKKVLNDDYECGMEGVVDALAALVAEVEATKYGVAMTSRAPEDYRVPQTPNTGLGAIMGKWPGDEPDEKPVICPQCKLERPTGPSDEYPCCNPDCRGMWGTNCWHCHHPRFWVEPCS